MGPQGGSQCVILSPNGRYLCVVGIDARRRVSVFLWDVSKVVSCFGMCVGTNSIMFVALSNLDMI